jgi:hypothetical protein
MWVSMHLANICSRILGLFLLMEGADKISLMSRAVKGVRGTAVICCGAQSA